MGKKKTEISDVPAAVGENTTNEAPKFTAETLKPYALKLFGVSISTFVGATYNLHGEYTVEEMRSHINDWLKKEVK